MSPSAELSVWFVAFSLGACIGSFLNVCIFRIPGGRSVVRPASACLGCGRTLRWWENIPLVSFAILRGRCRSCGRAISWQYPLVELLGGLLAVVLWQRYHLTASLAVYGYLASCLVVAAFIDLRHRIIPDVISLPGIVLGFLASFVVPQISWMDSLLGLLLGGGVLYLVAWGYYLFSHREGMGGGDIKLLAMIGAFLGWKAVPVVIFLSAAAGSLVGVGLIALRRGSRHMAVPYGPFLAGAALVTLNWGSTLVDWYVKLLAD